MSKPTNAKTHEDATATGASEAVHYKGHHNVTLVVNAPALSDLDSLTVRVEGSPDGSTWFPLKHEDGTGIEVSAAAIVGGDAGQAHKMAHGLVSEYLRVNITDYTDAAGGDLLVDTWLILGGHNGPAQGGA